MAELSQGKQEIMGIIIACGFKTLLLKSNLKSL